MWVQVGSKSSQVNFISNIRIYIHKNTIFNNRNKHRNKNNCNSSTQKWAKAFSNDPWFYPYSILISKSSGNCNDINNPYTKLCVLDVVKSVNVKVFNLLPKTSETGYVSWHGTCARKCRLEASVCNDRQRWNNDKCKCDCK